MAQFDVYENPGNNRKSYPYVVDIQSPYISGLATRIVLPLGYASSFNSQSMTRLTPEIAYGDEQLLLLTPQISAMPARLLRNPIGSLAHFRDQIINSLDYAISGI